jgi:hypothetical protein
MIQIFAGEAEMNKLPEEAADMVRKLQELAAFREDYIRRKGLTLSFKHACSKIGITPYTVKKHALELYEKWDDTNFHWGVAGEHTLH